MSFVCSLQVLNGSDVYIEDEKENLCKSLFRNLGARRID